MGQHVLPLYSWVVVQWMYTSHFVSPWIHQWALELLLLWVIVNNAAYERGCACTCCVPFFPFFVHSSGYIPQSGVAGSYGKPVFNLGWGEPPIFHNGCTILHPHRQTPKGSNSYMSSPALVIFCFCFSFYHSRPNGISQMLRHRSSSPPNLCLHALSKNSFRTSNAQAPMWLWGQRSKQNEFPPLTF